MEMLGGHVAVFASGSEALVLNNHFFARFFAYEKVDFAFLALQGVPGQAVSSAVRAGLRLPIRLGTALLGCLLAYVLHRALSE